MGRATVELLHARGAFVVGEDVNPEVKDVFKGLDGIVPSLADPPPKMRLCCSDP